MITIKGAELVNVSLEIKDGKVEGAYNIVSSTDAIIAKQTFNGYSDIKVTLSKETVEAKNKFVTLLKSDVNSILGLN